MTAALRPDLAVIAGQIAPGSRVLDVGCGDGTLMAALGQDRGAVTRGLEIDPDNVARAMARGLAVVQGDADHDLDDYPGDSFDTAILSQTLQTTRFPDRVIAGLLRIAPDIFVSFPNFAHWRARWYLMRAGRMPVTAALPVDWYATPNIHHLTIADFAAFVAARDVVVTGKWCLSGGRAIGPWADNWRAEQAIFRLGRAGRVAAGSFGP